MAKSADRRTGDSLEREIRGKSQLPCDDEALRRNEEKYRSLFESMRQGVLYQRSDGTLVDVNPAALALLGVSREEFLGKTSFSPAWDVIREDGSPLPPEEHPSMRALRTGKPVRNVVLAVRNGQTGRYVWMSVNAIPQFREGETAPHQVMVTLHDITDLKEALEELTLERNRAQRYLDIAEVILVALDAEGRITLINRKGSRILGYEEGELLGRSWFDACLPERHRDRVKEVFAQLKSGSMEWAEYNENPVLTKTGEERVIAWHNLIIRDGSGTPTGTFSSGEDITDRRAAEEALRQSEMRLRTAVEMAGLNAWVVDPESQEFQLIHVTDEFKGMHAGEAIPIEHGLQFIHPDDREALTASFSRAAETGELMKVESRVIMPDGSMRWVVSQGSRIAGTASSPRRFFGISLDVTERKEEEAARLRAGKMQALGTLAGGIAHDFNNILLAIAGNARLAIGDLSPEHPVQENLAEIEKASARAASLVRRILSFSRSGEQVYDVLRLEPVAEEAIKFLRSTVPAMIEIRFSSVGDVPAVAGDPTQIHEAVANLVANAAHAIGDQKGLIDVRLDAVTIEAGSRAFDMPAGRCVRLSVRDDGCGMDGATMARIFDPFFTTKPKDVGTGLGLFIVQGIMKNHKGAVRVESAPGVGSTFTLYFPPAGGAVECPSTEAQELPRGRGEHVLFVDDEEAIVDIGVRMLERLGYHVTAASDPARALGMFQLRPRDFDAVVTDLAMPGMSGLDLARHVLAVRPDVPVLLSSGNVPAEIREAALGLGVLELIQKPETINELGRALDHALRRPGKRAERVGE